LINKTFAQLNAERAARRTEYEECQDQNNPGWREIHKYNKKKQKEAASHKPQAASATKKPQMIFKTILEFEKDN